MIIENPVIRKPEVKKNESPDVAKKGIKFKSKEHHFNTKGSGGHTGGGLVVKKD
jgi:hypothetical protein